MIGERVPQFEHRLFRWSKTRKTKTPSRKRKANKTVPIMLSMAASLVGTAPCDTACSLQRYRRQPFELMVLRIDDDTDRFQRRHAQERLGVVWAANHAASGALAPEFDK